jgi:hypothetical protein
MTPEVQNLNQQGSWNLPCACNNCWIVRPTSTPYGKRPKTQNTKQNKSNKIKKYIKILILMNERKMNKNNKFSNADWLLPYWQTSERERVKASLVDKEANTR